MLKIPFTKMHGLGNDFIVVNSYFSKLENYIKDKEGALLSPALAQKICDRHFGVGADQILHLVNPIDTSCDVRMDILNQDGSLAEMCGNGIRAVALFLKEEAGLKKPELKIETLGGIKKIQLKDLGDYQVDMGAPELGDAFFKGGEEIKIDGFLGRFFVVGMGNPHAVFFINTPVESFPLEKIGKQIENHSRFPERTNVEFVEVLSEKEVNLRVWERGSGATLACGTGACATGVALIGQKKTKSPVKINLPGGSLIIEWNASQNLDQAHSSVFMTGPAEKVFEGVFYA